MPVVGNCSCNRQIPAAEHGFVGFIGQDAVLPAHLPYRLPETRSHVGEVDMLLESSPFGHQYSGNFFRFLLTNFGGFSFFGKPIFIFRLFTL
jgi:hypothetical protein